MIKSICLTLAIGTIASAQELAPINARVVRGDYAGRAAIHLVPAVKDLNTDVLGVATGVTFRDGVIDLDVAGKPLPDAPADSRGFIGVAFRVRPEAKAYECVYIRPTNGRADDQLRRNHSVQYVSEPEYPWHRLRKESPGVYESYADMEAGKWTHLRVVVRGNKAQVFVNRAEQPALIVNDLKLGQDGGGVALWSTQSTDGWFANLKIQPY
jgi:hypothetical protein